MAAPMTAEIAASAARLVVEEGMEYGAAKRKAARALGQNRPTLLPSNEAVEDEVRAHLALFCADTQPAELRALRELALGWMERLAEFRPHVAGAVWRGTATRLSAVQLELYCDDAKSAEIALINRGIDYDSATRPDGHGGEATVLIVTVRSQALADHVTLHLTVLDHDALRGALKPDAQGRSWRGDTEALRRRLTEGAT
ncbi:hypothetical protein HLB44_07020 [Aquincola sp. S2]|uniref:Nucleotidyltransferase n=1 Tax=Pseudaquabacterium terrae TaxID=2732868 RepID=A0ABX2EC52_9BURK|nr:hypothetical protein [Aquabacterium terrae]NRF66729.1 hypothetical protein [Aquabacterium terrae]